ncbi:MAG: DUF1194 domain-containing protein [Hyphomicrobiaceae bacterium]
MKLTALAMPFRIFHWLRPIGPSCCRTSLRAPLRLAGFVVVAGLVLAMSSRGPASEQFPSKVDLSLVLAIDCSWSISNEEFDLQMLATANAFRNPAVIDAILRLPKGRIAISLMQWSGPGSATVALPWTIVDSRLGALEAANKIESLKRRVAGGPTSISSALQFAASHILKSKYSAERQVIDISADGRNNRGGPPELSRDLATRLGITINGLTILSKEYSILDRYFRKRVIGGPGSFVEVANDHAAYPEAILRKLLREIPHTN